MEKGCVTVYAASSPDVAESFLNAAKEVGRLLVDNRKTLVCGAGRTGLMAAAIDGALLHGGDAIGVIPRFMVDNGWNHPKLTKMIVTDDMHDRKQTMISAACGIIALPGGVGTLEELLEAITWRQLGLYHGNIVILNLDGYYNPLIKMLQQTIKLRFMRPDHDMLWMVADTPAEAVEMVLKDDNHSHPFTQKIPNK